MTLDKIIQGGAVVDYEIIPVAPMTASDFWNTPLVGTTDVDRYTRSALIHLNIEGDEIIEPTETFQVKITDISAPDHNVDIDCANEVAVGVVLNDDDLSAINPGRQDSIEREQISLELDDSYIQSNSATFSVSNLPPGLTLDSDLVIRGTIEAGAADINQGEENEGDYLVELSVGTPFDAPFDNLTTQFIWHVDSSAPSINDPGDWTNEIGERVWEGLSASDPNDARSDLTFSAAGLPSWAEIAPYGLISGTVPTEALGDTYTVTLTVTDPDGETDTATFDWEIIRRVGQFKVISYAPQGDNVWNYEMRLEWQPPAEWNEPLSTTPKRVSFRQIADTMQDWEGGFADDSHDTWHPDNLAGATVTDWVYGNAVMNLQDDPGQDPYKLGSTLNELEQQFETCAVVTDALHPRNGEILGCVNWTHHVRRESDDNGEIFRLTYGLRAPFNQMLDIDTREENTADDIFTRPVNQYTVTAPFTEGSEPTSEFTTEYPDFHWPTTD